MAANRRLEYVEPVPTPPPSVEIREVIRFVDKEVIRYVEKECTTCAEIKL